MTKINKDYVFFWGKNDIYSNFYPVKFKHQGRTFHNSEQAFMWRKAQYFKDWLIAGKILQMAQQPNYAKSLGRKVKNYNDEQWEKVRVDIMKEVVYDKFSQTNLKYQMLEDGNNREFVESSPYDSIWGIGMKDNDPKINDKDNWKGQNLLGKVMNDVYQKLKEDK